MHELLRICIPGLIGGIVGGCIGPFIQHKFTQSRDREARKRADVMAKEKRKRDFLSFLHQWRTEIPLARGPDKLGADPPAVTAYCAKLPSQHSWIVQVQNDFTDRTKFEALSKRLGTLRAEDWQNKQPSAVILDALDALVNFIEHN